MINILDDGADKLLDYGDDVSKRLKDKKDLATNKSMFCLYNSLDILNWGIVSIFAVAIFIVILVTALVSLFVHFPFTVGFVVLSLFGYFVNKKCNADWNKRNEDGQNE